MPNTPADAILNQNAIRHSYEEHQRFGTVALGTPLRILVRRWQLDEDALRKTALAALAAITSVTDPKCDANGNTSDTDSVYTGDWRAVKCFAGTIKDSKGMWLFQVLVQGEWTDTKYLKVKDPTDETRLTPVYMISAMPEITTQTHYNEDGWNVSFEGFGHDRDTATYNGVIIERKAVKLETGAPTGTDPALTWPINLTDIDGITTQSEYDNLTLTEMQARLAYTFYLTVRVNWSYSHSTVFPGRYKLRISTREVNDIPPPNADVWEGYGEEMIPPMTIPRYFHDTQGRRWHVALVRTSSRTKAKGYADGNWTSSGSYGNMNPATYFIMGGMGGHTTGTFYIGRGRWMGVRVEGLLADFPRVTAGS